MNSFKQRIISKKLTEELSIKNGVVEVNTSSCDGCGSCVSACPHAAIELRALSTNDVKNLSFKGRLKVRIKGNVKAHIDTDLCTACGMCMKQCHEFAIHKRSN